MLRVHGAFVGTIVALVAILTVVELLNLRHTRRCIEDGYGDVRSFDDEDRRYRFLQGKVVVRTLYRVLLAAFVLGFVYLGPIDWLVERPGSRGNLRLWVGVGFSLVLAEALVEEGVRLLEPRLAYRRAGMRVSLRQWIRHRLGRAITGVIVSWLLVALVFYSVDRWPDLWPWYFLTAVVLLQVGVNLVSPLYHRWRWREESEPVPGDDVSTVLARFDVEPSIVDVESTNENIVETSEIRGIGPSRTVFIREHDGSRMEFRADLAHELGHAEHRHIEKDIAYDTAVLGIDALLVAQLLTSSWFYDAFQIPQGMTHAALVVALIWIAAVHRLVFSTVKNWLSHRYEYVADSYTFDEGYTGLWGHSLRDYCDSSLTNPYQHPLYSLFNTTHPPIAVRIQRERNT